MDRLPAELLMYVFLFVESGKRGRLALVCRGWKRVLDYASLWKDATAYLGKYSKRQYRSIDTRHVSKAKLVQGFDWTILPPRMCDVNVGGLYDNFGRLLTMDRRVLCNLTRLDNVTDADMVFATNSMPNLSCLNVTRCVRLSNSSMDTFNYTRLVHLNMSCCIHVTNGGLYKLCIPTLRTLHASQVWDLLPACYAELLICMPELEDLEINYAEDFCADVLHKFVLTLKKLRVLTLFASSEIDIHKIKLAVRDYDCKYRKVPLKVGVASVATNTYYLS
ncbi:F-box/LRR-repeat protein 7-like [Ixodes scapularis]|uniref:F-box/LRR-repeat protein 7-like n=1 Tax=Ixodes scapularis TaxID=6945 RepID=UPI001A9F0AD9|nr:F-box/LRR-repeat protein 7-like [Ixodes scapularis]